MGYELAWAAGFFDGEGSTCVIGNGLALSITQQDRYSLDRFHAATGGFGLLNGPYVYADERAPRYEYRVCGLARIQAVLSTLWPYLGPVKKAQAEVALERWVGRSRKRRIRTSRIDFPVARGRAELSATR